MSAAQRGAAPEEDPITCKVLKFARTRVSLMLRFLFILGGVEGLIGRVTPHYNHHLLPQPSALSGGALVCWRPQPEDVRSG